MTEQEMEDFTSKIEQLRQTIDGQELSQEDVRGMELAGEGAYRGADFQAGQRPGGTYSGLEGG
jgi:hypothetical protein